MFSRIKRELTERTLYEQFELIVSGIVLFLVSAIIVYATILISIIPIQDFYEGLGVKRNVVLVGAAMTAAP